MMAPPDLRGAVGKFPDHILRMSEGYDHADAVRGEAFRLRASKHYAREYRKLQRTLAREAFADRFRNIGALPFVAIAAFVVACFVGAGL